jgi:hypothetical protein
VKDCTLVYGIKNPDEAYYLDGNNKCYDAQKALLEVA